MRKNILLAILLAFAGDCMAVPAYPAKSKMRKKDGTTVELTLRGDEHFAFYSSNDGQYYVKRDKKFFDITAEQITEQWTARKQTHEQQEKSSRRKIKRLPEVREYKGKKKGVVILIEFDEQKFSVSNPAALYKQVFNQKGYKGNEMTGSVRDYFLEQSYGQLDIEFDVAGPFKAEKSMSYYGAPNGGNNDTRPWEIVIEGCKAADKELNFADYDWDGDGEVDQVFVIYAGYGQNYGASEYTIWPHEYFLGARALQFKLDGTLINTYACSCELYGNEGTQLDGIGAACHEFSHCLGLPDMYNTSAGTANGMMDWDVMCQGSYNNYGRTPAGFTAYERMYSGWLTPVELKERTAVTGMKPLATTPEAYILYNDNHPDEFYMLENRQPVGFDAGLSGHGLIITHIDYDHDIWASNDVNSNSAHQRCAVVPADNQSQLTEASLAADPFPGTKGVTQFSRFTTPAMTLFNEDADGNKYLKKPIDSITEDGQLISFVACRPELGKPAFTDSKTAGDYSWTVKWDAVADAVGYELELTEQPVARHDLETCRMLEEDFSGFYSKSNGLSDVSSKIATYITNSKGWAGSKLFTSPNLLRIGTSTATGYINSPTFDLPTSGEITVVIGVEPFDANTKAEGSVRFITNSGTTAEAFSFEKAGKQVFHFNSRDTRFRVGVSPVARIYLNYLAIYEGTFTEEELGIETSEPTEAKSRIGRRKAMETLTYSTSDPQYTFNGLTPGSTYFCRVRTVGEVNKSEWCEEISFVPEGELVKGDVNCDGKVDISDIVAIINCIAGTASYSRADVNDDKNVDISDIVAVINIIAKQ